MLMRTETARNGDVASPDGTEKQFDSSADARSTGEGYPLSWDPPSAKTTISYRIELYRPGDNNRQAIDDNRGERRVTLEGRRR